MWIARVNRVNETVDLPRTLLVPNRSLKWGCLEASSGPLDDSETLLYIDKLTDNERRVIDRKYPLTRVLSHRDSLSLFTACRKRVWTNDDHIEDLPEFRDFFATGKEGCDQLLRVTAQRVMVRRAVAIGASVLAAALLGNPLGVSLAGYSLLTSDTGTAASAWTVVDGLSSDVGRGGTAKVWTSSQKAWCLNPRFYVDGAAGGFAYLAGHVSDRQKVVIKQYYAGGAASAMTRIAFTPNMVGYAAGGYGVLVRYYNNTLGLLASGTSCAAGDETTLISEGANQVALLNGASDMAASDSGCALGSPGFGAVNNASQHYWVDVYQYEQDPHQPRFSTMMMVK